MTGIISSPVRFISAKAYQLFLIIYCIGGLAAIYFSVTRGLNRAHIGFAFIAGSAVCMLLVHTYRARSDWSEKPNGPVFKATIVIWLLVFAYSIFLLLDSFASYYLSLPYFLALTLLALIIAYQILSTNNLTGIHVFAIFVEIAVLALVLSGSFIYLFPAPIGNDAAFHVDYLTSIVNTGNMNSYPYVDQYANFPVYQLTFSGLLLLPEINLPAAELILALVQVLAVLFIFITCEKIFNVRIGLLASLLTAMSSQLIIPRYSFYPSNYAIIYFMLFLFVLLMLRTKKLNTFPVILTVLLAVNLMHPLASVLVTFTVILCYVFSKPFKLKLIDVRYVILSLLLMLTQFVRPIPHSDSLASKLSLYVSNIVSGSNSVTQATMSQLYSWSDVLLYDMGFTLLIMFGVAGALLIIKWNLNKKKDLSETHKEKMVFLSAVTLVITPVPYVLAMISPNMLPDRWFVYITVFLSVFAAVAIYLFAQRSRKVKILMLAVVPVIIFFFITSPISNPNTHIYLTEMSTRPTLTLSESVAANFFKDNVNLTSIFANSLYAGRVDYSIFLAEHYIDPRKNNDGKVMVIRNYDMENGFTIPLYGSGGKLLEIIKPTDTFSRFINSSDRFYDNGDTRAVLNSGWNDYLRAQLQTNASDTTGGENHGNGLHGTPLY
jgi:hypothetical protein